MPFRLEESSKSSLVEFERRVIDIDAANCVGCGLCMMACSWVKQKQFNPTLAFVDIQRDDQREGDFDAQFTELCDACGFCAHWCYYDAIHFHKPAKKVGATNE